ncbi:MAG TPA: cell division protein FtsA [Gemmatimonadaceae bacterium]|jgi:cell division protein FtsA|nr:MAG: cell division protein FtsA [Gemmatimonadetes bacterium SCN 70-22]HMN08630.1 cell division protein FtsA [Gemmatimonadaceae bacterium]
MNVERLVAGLDIGSAKTTAIIAEVVGDLPRHPGIKVLGVGQSRTTGLRRGVVADIEETTQSIRKAVSDAEQMAGAKVDACYVGIAGEHVQAMISKGIVAVSGDEITRGDVERANAVARAQAIPPERELLHSIPQEYTVDKNEGIRDPVGMVGTRLETEMYLVTIGSSPALNLRKAVERAGYKPLLLVLEPLASALAVLTEDEKELGVALIEMGAGTTDIAVFHEAKIRHLGTVPFGGNNVTNDIVHGLGVTQADAERLKERYGCAYEPMVDPSEVITLPSTVAQGDRQIPRELLAHIIHQRMDEIYDLVMRDIEAAGYVGKLSAGVVLTGGAATLPGVSELAAEVFGTGVRVGIPSENISGLVDAVEAPRFATAVGLALYAASRVALGAESPSGRKLQLNAPNVDKLAQRVKTWLQDFF